MSSFSDGNYCNNCATTCGMLLPLPTNNLTGSAYQLRKFMKHTIPNSGSYVTIFDSADYSTYHNYMVDTMVSGSVEVKRSGMEINYVLYSGTSTGFALKNGSWQGPVDGVKVVLANSSINIHAFPTGSSTYNTCIMCGDPIL